MFLWLKQIFYINSYIVLPIETLKKENYKSTSYTPNSPKDIIYNEYCSSFFTEIEIGTPPQKIPLLVKMKTNDYIITSIHPMDKNSTEDFTNKSTYDFSEKFFKNYDYFNENKSSTFSSKICEDRRKKYKYDYDYEWPIAEETCSSYDTFNLYTNINMKKKSKINNIYFDLVKNVKDNITGLIGLSLNNDYRTQNSFLNILKNKNLTENYYWSFDFENPEQEKGKLIIGTRLDIIKKGYSFDNLNHAKGKGYNFWEMTFAKVFIKNSTEKILLKDNSAGEFNYDINTVCAPYEYREYFRSLMNNLFTEGKCFNDTFEGCSDLYSKNGGTWIFYYCKNEKEIEDELNRLILPIQFQSNELNYTFEIKTNDILKKVDDYIYIKILFQQYGGNWVLGKPFLLKYDFMLNPKIKEIGFYSGVNKNMSKKSKKWVLILVIIGLCAICGVLGVLLGKKIYGLKRKKRANEMLDDDYEYFSENQEKKEDENNKNELTDKKEKNIKDTIN